MRCLVYCYAPEIAKQLAIQLIPKGFEPIEVENVDEVYALLKMSEKNHLLITENVQEEFLQKVRETDPDIALFLLYHVSMKPSEVIKLQKAGVQALIEYMEDTPLLSDIITDQVIRNHIKVEERRKHVRVMPAQYENNQASVFIKGIGRFVQGRLIDLSAGGVAIKLNDSIEASILDKDKVYNPLVLHIRGMEIKTIAKLIGKREDFAGFKFEIVEEKDMTRISSYIHMRLQESKYSTIKAMMRNEKK